MPIKWSSERGDTLVEVLVAISVLSIVIVGAFSLMNKGAAQMYDSMERSEVRLLLDQQVESLNYARDQYFIRASTGTPLSSAEDNGAADVWGSIRGQSSIVAAPDINNGCNTSTYAFYIERDAATGNILAFNSGIPPSKKIANGFPQPGNGIWMQKIDSSLGASVPYKDFYLRACWWPTGSTQMQAMSTVVRLYDR